MALDISTTNFPDGISSFGITTMGVGGLLPFAGRYIFVDATLGNDGYPGTANNPVATLTQALALCGTGNKNDVIFVTGTISLTATLEWSLNKTHLIGLTAPSNNDRARLSASGTVFTPMVNVTGQGCIFANIGTFYGFASASAQICWHEAGGRNYYNSCQFMGMGNATAAAHVGSRSLKVSGSNGENRFVNCQIGLDTVTRSAVNASLEFSGAVMRNTFENCRFPFMTSDAGALGILASGAGAIDRWQEFVGCKFINNIQSTSTQMSALTTLSASAGGLLLFKDCTMVGITEFGTDATTRNQCYVDGGAPTAASTGIAVVPT